MRIDDVLAVLSALEREGVDYAVIGAMAMAAHGLDRATRDLDLFVRPSEENVARLRRALRFVFDDAAIDEITAGDLGGDYPAIRYGPPEVDFTIDLVSRLGDAFTIDDLHIVETHAGSTTIRVASPATLYRMKRDTVRGRDRDDAARLRDAFDIEE
ncbi:nucleotidyl transferase AbiEii/AbiGii toxin family protein [Egibacter rhizosphaerae]|uniref:nucleotidyl transferase AbiEii/AbiGii toxin family protein n=1 Tax=Egibacter rhizosphaerae TaxID=1670831 RepID=UPI0013F15452|nr:nucleotidyl transferase AbiEii/AbiGii toxin family protein [Egibacter rhizosphaerae]